MKEDGDGHEVWPRGCGPHSTLEGASGSSQVCSGDWVMVVALRPIGKSGEKNLAQLGRAQLQS